MTDIEILEEARKSWIPFESESTPEIRSSKNKAWKHPSHDFDRFYSKIAYEFTNGQDGFWLQSAIEYSQYAVDKELARNYLSYLLDNAESFAWVGALLGSTANYLGMISQYPDPQLKRLIEEDLIVDDEFEQSSLTHLKSMAFGAYISTATDFNTGFEAGQAMEASGETPTVELAEKIIVEWRAKHQVTT